MYPISHKSCSQPQLIAPAYIAQDWHIDRIVDVLGDTVDAVTKDATSARVGDSAAGN